MAKFEVNILGCGSASPSYRHKPSCQVVNFRDNLYMIDCGEGAQLQYKMKSLKFSRLRHIFISHLHGDHFFGLPGLLSTMALHEIGGTLNIHIFEEGRRMLEAWAPLIFSHGGMQIKWDILRPGERRVIVDEPSLEVSTFPLYHGVACQGFIFREKESPRHLKGDMAKYHNIPLWQIPRIKAGDDFVTPDGRIIPNDQLTLPAEPPRSYAYCSDTMADPRVVEDVRGVDVLYHEATYADDLRERAALRGHSTSLQAAETAKEAGARLLILGHFSNRYSSEAPLKEEACSIFPETVLANEGLTIAL